MRSRLQLPARARRVAREDAAGVPTADPGCETVIDAATDWLCRAQDNTASDDDGVARDYSLVTGWATSYPETTGYIIPTLLAVAAWRDGDAALTLRVRRMLDWCRDIQMDDGGFQGGKIDAEPRVAVTFNTGQILLGLAAGARQLDDYHEPMHAAARFLRDSLDSDGCWRSHPTPFAQRGEKAYETHVAWGLFEAERVAPGQGYGEAGLRQVAWAIGRQQANGWVADCCLNDPQKPLTHTLGYYLKGLVEAHRLSGDTRILRAAGLTGEALLSTQRPDGALPGRVNPDLSAAVDWSCLTGNVQIADSWFYLAEACDDDRFANAARRANAFVRRTVDLANADDGIRGGVKGSFPVDGDYGSYEYLNWAAKFLIDACLSEIDARQAPSDD